LPLNVSFLDLTDFMKGNYWIEICQVSMILNMLGESLEISAL